MRRTVLAIAAFLFAVIACNAITGAGSFEVAPEGTPPDRVTPDVVVTGDGSNPAGDAGCATTDASPNQTGSLTARRVNGIDVDGRLDEWECIPFVHVNPSVGHSNPGPSSLRADFAVAWSDSMFYMAARVTDETPASGNSSEQDQNDSVELYLDGDGTLTGTYGPTDWEVGVDHKGLRQIYQPGGTAADFPVAARRDGNVLFYEMGIAASKLGALPLAAGRKMGFDMLAIDGNGTTNARFLFWHYAPGCTCTTGCCCGQSDDYPYCNTQRFGFVTLSP